MANISEPIPVKYFVAILYKDSEYLLQAQEKLTKFLGKLDFEGEDHNFDITGYYESEMGSPLLRRIITFKRLRSPQDLSEMKIKCNDVENGMSVSGNRTVNLDVGYLDHNKIILASAKAAGQKIYLKKGIYADLVGRYKKGRYQPFEWSFPDFKAGYYDQELNIIRSNYLTQNKENS